MIEFPLVHWPYDCAEVAVPLDAPADWALVHARHGALDAARASERLTVINKSFMFLSRDPLLCVFRNRALLCYRKVSTLAAGNSGAGGDAADTAQCSYDDQ